MKTKILIAILILLVLGGIGTGLYFAFKTPDDKKQKRIAADGSETKTDSGNPLIDIAGGGKGPSGESETLAQLQAAIHKRGYQGDFYTPQIYRAHKLL